MFASLVTCSWQGTAVSFVCSSGLGSAHAVFPFTRRAAAAVFRGLVRYDGSKSYTDTTKEFKVAGQSSIDLSGSQSIMPVYSKFWSTFRMPRMEPLLLEKLDNLRPIVEASKARMGFVPNSMRILAQRPEMLFGFRYLSEAINGPSATIDRSLRSLVAQMASRAAGCG
jgi:hypothetical protein